MGKLIKKQWGEITAYEMRCGWGPQPLITVYCYLAAGILIDTGPRRLGHAVLNALQGTSLNRVLLTHHHEDHSGNAARIHQQWQVPVHGHPYARHKLARGYKILPYQHMLFGATSPVPVIGLPPVIEADHLQLIPIHTPGHSKDHTVYLEKNQGWLFSGDLYVGSRIKFFRADEDLSETIASLRTLSALEFDTLFCAHNPQMQGAKKCIQEKLSFFENFLGEIDHLRNHQGMDQKAVIKHLAHREQTLIKWFTFGNASFTHLVRSAWQALPPIDAV